MGVAVANGRFGALLAIVWEVGEYFAFIRFGSELDGAYEDTLGDEVLGGIGALLAGVWMAVRSRRRLAARLDLGGIKDR
jgi:hypothetical protein